MFSRCVYFLPHPESVMGISLGPHWNKDLKNQQIFYQKKQRDKRSRRSTLFSLNVTEVKFVYHSLIILYILSPLLSVSSFPLRPPPSLRLPQVGGSMPAVSPTSTGFTTRSATTSASSTASSGTTSEAPATPCAPPPWWYDPTTSDGPPKLVWWYGPQPLGAHSRVMVQPLSSSTCTNHHPLNTGTVTLWRYSRSL